MSLNKEQLNGVVKNLLTLREERNERVRESIQTLIDDEGSHHSAIQVLQSYLQRSERIVEKRKRRLQEA